MTNDEGNGNIVEDNDWNQGGGSIEEKEDKNSSIYIFLGILVGTLIIVLLIVLIVVIQKKKKSVSGVSTDIEQDRNNLE